MFCRNHCPPSVRELLVVAGCQPSLRRLFGSSRRNTIAADIEAHRGDCVILAEKTRTKEETFRRSRLAWRGLMHPSELILCDFSNIEINWTQWSTMLNFTLLSVLSFFYYDSKYERYIYIIMHYNVIYYREDYVYI